MLPQASIPKPFSEKDPTKTSARYITLCVACFAYFGCYFAYDIPSALQTQLQEVTST